VALHALIFVSWPFWDTQTESPPEPESDLLVELVLLEPEAPPEPDGEQPAIPDRPDDKPVADVDPEWTAFVYADGWDESDGGPTDVISAISEQAPDVQGKLAAAESGELSEADAPSAAAAPSSVAIPISADVIEQVAGAPQTDPSVAGAERDVPVLANADDALAGTEHQERIEEAGEDLVDVDGSADALDLFKTDSEPIPEPPSMALSGAAGADGGERLSTQAVVEEATTGRRSFTRRSSTPLGRYTNRVYDVLRKRWHRQEVGLMPVSREVTVRFEIARLGATSHTTIVASSGDPMLDAIARSSVPKRLAPFPAALAQRTIEQQVTFRYEP